MNTLPILALLIGILACPFAALFGHIALGQLKASGERGVIPAWIAIVLGYLWLGFWIVFGITYLATNGSTAPAAGVNRVRSSRCAGAPGRDAAGAVSG